MDPDKVYLEVYLNELGQISLRDQYHRDVMGIAAIRVTQSWNTEAPLGGGATGGCGMVSVDIVIKPRPAPG